MSKVSMLSGDWEILFQDEKVGGSAVAGMRMIRRTATATSTIYTTLQLYSAVADNSDAFQAMGFTNSMLPTTPNAFTVENKFFIPRRDIQFLKNGALTMDLTVSAGEGVYKKTHDNTGTAPVVADIGRQVTEATSLDTGTLLDFETEPDGTFSLWIRPDTAGDTFALSTALTTTGDGGTMSVTGVGAAISGECVYPSIQAIGSVPAATEVYLLQNRFKMTNYTGGFQWWATDPTVSLGIIDILVRTKNAGVTIADGDVEVFSRRYTSLYDNFRLNVAAGGRSALPLASAPDINNTNGYRQVTGSAGVSDIDVGNYIYAPAAGGFAAAVKKGVVTKVAGTIGAPIVDYYLIGDLTDFVATDTVKEYDPNTAADGDGSFTAGTPVLAPGGPTDTASGEGGSVTLALGGFLVDHDGDAATEPYSVQINAQSNVPIAKVYERLKYITRRGALNTDLFGAGVNIPGEAYRGLDGITEYDTPTGTLTEGDDITVAATGWSARLLNQNTTNSPTYITFTDQQTSLDFLSNNDIIADEAGGDQVLVNTGTLGIKNFTSSKASPFGTFTGSQIFGARGVSYINFASTDLKSYILTDDLGTLRTPPNTQAFVVSNTAAGDRVLVARDTGTAGVIDKDQFGGLDTPATTYNGLADLEIRVAGSIDSEVPQAGYVRVVDTTLLEEHHYVYVSRTIGALGVFTLRNVVEGTGVTSASATNLIDTTADFTNVTNPVEVGMLVRNTFAGKTTHVWEVTLVNSATNLSVRQLYGPGGATQDWDVGDTYTINTLIGRHTTPGDYAATDNVYDLLIDKEASGTSVTNSFVKTPAANFGTIVNVRNGKVILPFTQNVTVTDAGGSASTVRTPDTIAV